MDCEGQRYYDAGQSFRNARSILEGGCDFPPSYESFCQELKDTRRYERHVTPEIMARRIVDGYKRTDLYGY